MNRKIYAVWAIVLTVAAGLTSCSDEESENAAGLSVAAFYPTIVMDGTEVEITGSGLSAATDVVFPGGQSAKAIRVAGDDRIVATAPANVADLADVLTVITADGEVQSRQTIRKAKPAVRYFNPSDQAKTYEDLQIEGNDFLLVKSVEIGEGADAVKIDALDFKRKSNTNITLTLPGETPVGSSIPVKTRFQNGELLALGKLDIEKGVQPGGKWVEQEIDLYNGGDVEMGGWSGYINTIYADAFANAQIGDRIRVYIKDQTEGWQQGSFKHGSTWAGLTDELGVIGLSDDDFAKGYYEMTIDEVTLPLLQEFGLIVSGCNYTAIKVVLITNVWVSNGQEPHEIDLYSGDEVVMGGWSGYINTIYADAFADAQIGDIIRVYIKDQTEGWQQGSFKHGSTWAGLTDELGVIGLSNEDFERGYYEMTIDEVTLPLLQEAGLIVSGCNYTATKVVLIMNH